MFFPDKLCRTTRYIQFVYNNYIHFLITLASNQKEKNEVKEGPQSLDIYVDLWILGKIKMLNFIPPIKDKLILPHLHYGQTVLNNN